MINFCLLIRLRSSMCHLKQEAQLGGSIAICGVGISGVTCAMDESIEVKTDEIR